MVILIRVISEIGPSESGADKLVFKKMKNLNLIFKCIKSVID